LKQQEKMKKGKNEGACTDDTTARGEAAQAVVTSF